jgi:NTE family protein
MFPPVRIGDELHVDGGLRQNVPLSPARRLGADGILVINPRHLIATSPPNGQLETTGGPIVLLGKMLNALMLDRIDADLDRLRRINDILEAGQRAFGPRFVAELNRELGYGETIRLRPLRCVLVRASQDIGRLAMEYVRRPSFAARAGGLVSRLIRRLAQGPDAEESDLLSYVLFDGEFARDLIALGRADAQLQHEELCRFFAGA